MKAIHAIVVTLFLAGASLAVGQRQSKTLHYRFGGSDGGSMVQLSLRPDVQGELKVTPVQHQELATLDKKMQSNIADIVTAKHPTHTVTSIVATGEAFAAKLPAILSHAQYARLRALLFQKASYTSLMRKDVQTQLAFTKDQKAKVIAAQASLTATFKSIQKLKDVKVMRPKIVAAVNAHSETLKAILTKAQAAKFEAMKGKPFNFAPDVRGM